MPPSLSVSLARLSETRETHYNLHLPPLARLSDTRGMMMHTNKPLPPRSLGGLICLKIKISLISTENMRKHHTKFVSTPLTPKSFTSETRRIQIQMDEHINLTLYISLPQEVMPKRRLAGGDASSPRRKSKVQDTRGCPRACFMLQYSGRRTCLTYPSYNCLTYITESHTGPMEVQSSV
jgi:hypothetical protein